MWSFPDFRQDLLHGALTTARGLLLCPSPQDCHQELILPRSGLDPKGGVILEHF